MQSYNDHPTLCRGFKSLSAGRRAAGAASAKAGKRGIVEFVGFGYGFESEVWGE
jgi:hypothetical protein